MKFWDSSAIAPLLMSETASEERENALADDPEIVVWYATKAELESAICRRLREESLSMMDAGHARRKLEELSLSWIEIEPTSLVRERSIRMLRVHPLRTADAFQLAAALLACSDSPAGFHFLTADARLRAAALKEGLSA
ncbi:MAG: PIN domain-containing protein [Terrimicrobiaceae bacterium]